MSMFSESKTDANESLVLHPEAQHSIFIKSIVRLNYILLPLSLLLWSLI